MKRWAVGLLLLACLWPTWAWLRPTPKKAALPVSIGFTCDVRGRLVPCGCFTGQYGGLTRVATVLDSVHTADTLRFDVGDAIAGTADYQQIQHRFALNAFHQMGYDALNLGHREAALSRDQLLALKAEAKVPMLSANLEDSTSGEPLFDAFRILKRGPWRIAVVGLMDERIAQDALGPGLRVESMESVLARILPAIKAQSDFIILLAFTDETAIARLASQFYELDIILGGKVSQPSQKLIRENRSLVLSTTNQSRALGILNVTLVAPHEIKDAIGEVMLMRDDIRQKDSISTLATSYRAQIRNAQLSVDDPAALQADAVPGIKKRASYVGSQSCVECHPAAGKAWAASGHAHAFAALVERDADADPNCIGCHTIGFGTASGYRRKLGKFSMTDVGCESCHGPGNLHAAERKAGGEVLTKMRPLGAGDCQKCHFGEFSRPFSYEKVWPVIKH